MPRPSNISLAGETPFPALPFVENYGTIERERNRRSRAERDHDTQAGTLVFGTQVFPFNIHDLLDHGEIGAGGFSTVNKMTHQPSSVTLAVKRIRSAFEEEHKSDLLSEHDLIISKSSCPFIVQFYGANFYEGDCWICMELLDFSLHALYKIVYEQANSTIPEAILSRIAYCTTAALSYLKDELKTIHRDVKPSNILVNRAGAIKLCDFGISGRLIDSVARTRDVGCSFYMAPERIDPEHSGKGYDIRSDVWSFGITMVELATGVFPYKMWETPFEQMMTVMSQPAPQLTAACGYSPAFVAFVNSCLCKSVENRPIYHDLLALPLLVQAQADTTSSAAYFTQFADLASTNL